MSGHNKWSTIKHKKAASDAKKGKVFSKIAREIMVAVRVGGGDPGGNITLRALVQKGRASNMPADNIDRAIKKGLGDLGGATLDEITYEAYAAGGIGIIVQVLTDNRNRSAAEVRHVLNRHNANLAQLGAVSRGFQRKGQIVVASDKIGEDRLMEIVLEAGADDMTHEGDTYEILTDPTQFMNVVDALNKEGLAMEQSEVALIPDLYVNVTDKSQANAVLKLIDALEDLDDVQNVYTNMDIDASIADDVGG